MAPTELQLLARRTLRAALICLPVGLAMNLAAPVVWLSLGAPGSSWLVNDYGRRSWSHSVPPDWPADCEMVEHFRTWFSDSVGFAVPNGFGKSPDRTGHLPMGSSLDLYGWPCRSVKSWSLIWDYAPPIVANSSIYVDHGQIGRFPCSIVLRGTLINTLVYATALTGLYAGVNRLSGSRQKAGRRCKECLYSLEGLELGSNCPECGLPERR